MKTAGYVGVLLMTSMLSPLFVGCGGGSGTANSITTSADRGALAMQIHFPTGKSVKSGAANRTKNEPARIAGFSNGNIPVGTQAVKLEVVTTGSPETSLALPQVITAPSNSTNGVTGPVTVRFTNLPVGNVRLRATAYPDVAAKLSPIAVGTTDVAIGANATANANVALNLTIDHIAVTPASLTLDPTANGGQATLAATPMDKNNNPLLMALIISVDRSDVVSVGSTTPPSGTPAETSAFQAQVASPIFATLPATGTITIAEPNSGKTTAVSVTVTSNFD